MTNDRLRSRSSSARSLMAAFLLYGLPLTAQEEDKAERTESPPPSWTSGLSLALDGRYFRPTLYGNMLITKGGEPGSGESFNVREDLGVDAANTPQLGFKLALENQRLSFAYLPMHFEGDDTLSEPLVFHGTTYPAGQEVESQLDFTFFTFGYDYRILQGTVGELRIGLLAYYWIFDSTIEGSGPGGVQDEHRGFTSWYPTATICGLLRAGLFHVGASLAIGGLSLERSIIDTEGAVGVRLWDRLEIDLGYRYMHFDITETTNDGSLSAHGPFVQLSLIF